jgi:urease subunit alpha
VGSIEVGKLADLVLWKPAFFGVKPALIVKGGRSSPPPWATPTPRFPRRSRCIATDVRCLWPGAGQHLVSFVSQAALADGVGERLGLQRRLVAVREHAPARQEGHDPQHHTGHHVDAQNYRVHADGVLLACEPAKVLPMAQRYFLF